MPSFSFLLTLAVIVLHTTLASARPIDNSGNSYGGEGGHASGGNVTHVKNKNLLSFLGIIPIANVGSGTSQPFVSKGYPLEKSLGNAGHAGKADSGNSLALPGSNAGHLAGIGGSNSGNAYTKDGGVADGGSVQGTNDALINIDSSKV